MYAFRNRIDAERKSRLDAERATAVAKKKTADAEKRIVDAEKRIVDAEKKIVELSKKVKEAEENLTCRICFDRPYNIANVCGHTFCKECMQKEKTRSGTCPFCARILSQEIKLYII